MEPVWRVMHGNHVAFLYDGPTVGHLLEGFPFAQRIIYPSSGQRAIPFDVMRCDGCGLEPVMPATLTWIQQ